MTVKSRAGSQWTAGNIDDQHGRVAVVTGSNTGVGHEVAKQLAAHGATVVLACRDRVRGERAAERLRAATGTGTGEIRFVRTDLASLDSVRKAADEISTAFSHIDLLINNAGVMWAPQGETEDGFERHFGINHLGHFALTGLLLPRIITTPGSRIVVISSPAHRNAAIDIDDLQSANGYRAMRAYGRSKLANLMFAYELDRRIREAGAATIVLAAHPGGARSELNRSMPRLFRGKNWGLARPITHSVERGALSILRAATDPNAAGGEYYGPGGPFQFTGDPTLLQSSPRAHDTEAQQRLWRASEKLTGVVYDFGH